MPTYSALTTLPGEDAAQSLAEAMACAEQQIESRMLAIARLWRVAQGR